MTKVWPLRYREIGDRVLMADEAGGWFSATKSFLDRYGQGRNTDEDNCALLARGHAFQAENDAYFLSFATRWARRHRLPQYDINYLILVPTLRCNLACGYCQVSRAAENARGYDWDERTARGVAEFIRQLPTARIKIEFQGGEPLLRLDLLNEIRELCRTCFESASFVVCSNFQSVTDDAWKFFEAEDTSLSTSFDGTFETHTRQRTGSTARTGELADNLRTFVRRFGAKRLSALPTIDPANPPDPGAIIDGFAELGLNSIFLRPINYQGFARRSEPAAGTAATWTRYHRTFVDAVIERNFTGSQVFEEFYLSHVIRRILSPGVDNLVDLRNPNPLGWDHAVVDYDGVIYPTDEARMMARAGQVDLSIGDIWAGINRDRVDTLNTEAFNDLDPNCIDCPYQPFCGTDNVDAISRYGRVDVPRCETWFCQRQLGIFDTAFDLLTSRDRKVIHSLKAWTGSASWPTHFSETLS